MLRDSDFIRGKVPMTKEEIRAVVMAKAMLEENSIVYDIGAGTGSLAIQAALIAARGKVFAVEQNMEAVQLIRTNCLQLAVDNVELIPGSAPEALYPLPLANRIIVGGSGGKLPLIINTAHEKLLSGGKLMVTSVTLSSLHQSVEELTSLGYELDICQVAITKYTPVNASYMAKANNPIFIITGTKGD